MSAAPSTPRFGWIDTARGIAIILVVVGHCLRGLTEAEILSHPIFTHHVDGFIYMFHMHAFFILSGSFLIKQAQQTNALSFIWRLAQRLVYPLIIWTYAFIGLRALASQKTNSGTIPSDLLTLPLPPLYHMWFLWALFIGMVLFGLIAQVLPRIAKYPTFWCGVAVGAFFIRFYVDIPSAALPWIGAALRYMPFLSLGIALSLIPDWMRGDHPWPLTSVIAFTTLGILVVSFPPAPLFLPIASGVMALLFLQICQWISLTWGNHRLGTLLRHLGKLTMVIFLTHTIFSAAMRILLQAFAIDNPALHIAFGVIIGIVGPIVLYVQVQRLGLSRVLGF